jgi:hypothetical protein
LGAEAISVNGIKLAVATGVRLRVRLDDLARALSSAGPGGDAGRNSTFALWRSLPLRLALAAIPLWFTLALFAFHAGWPIELVVAIVLCVTLASPVHGLLLTAVLAPLGQLVASSIGAVDFRMSEAIVVAFLAGWLLRGLDDHEGPRVPVAGEAWLFALTVVAAIGRRVWQLRRDPRELRSAIDHVVHAYYRAGESMGIVEGARWLEGIALMVATMMLFRRKPSLAIALPVAIAASGVVAVAAREPMDPDAASSYFAMVAALAVGMMLRAHGRQRAAWAGAALVNAGGIWLAWTGGSAISRGSFTQLFAELGFLGLGALLLWIATAVVWSGGALLRTPDDSRLLGVTTGVVVVLAGCVISQPLAADEAAFAFWIQLGLMTALAGSTLLRANAASAAAAPNR